MSPMILLITLGVLATVGVMVAGGYSMARGGRYDEAHGFPLMEARVVLQALTVGLVIIATLFW